MSPKATSPSSAALLRRILTAAMAVAALMAANAFSFQSWLAARRTLVGLQAEVAQLDSVVKRFEKVHERLANQSYKVCNRSAETLSFQWIGAVYERNGTFQVFDSSRCPDWTPQQLPEGKTQVFSQTSTIAGCTWGSEVLLGGASFLYLDASGEANFSREYFGHWWNFEGGCFTVR